MSCLKKTDIQALNISVDGLRFVINDFDYFLCKSIAHLFWESYED